MKKIIIYTAMFFMAMSCQDALDIEPTNMIPEDAVINDPALVDAYLNNVYHNVRFQTEPSYEPNQAIIGVVGGEANVFAGWQDPVHAAMHIINENGAHWQMEYWPYQNIRAANEIIEILQQATFDEELIIQKTAEARWLRAFMYFELVKRYGGVPLITQPQSIDQPIEELYVPRDSEQHIYDFIADEMDDLVNILPESYGSENFGRPTRWAAYALKSRAMLYAGSIAKYGQVQLDGLLGIPSGEANTYYQEAYDAAMEVINNSPHQLFRQYEDPVQNYNRLFVEDANSEVIFAEVYDFSLLKTHAWNFVSMPDGFRRGWGSNNWMYLETFEKYEYTDGSSGKLNWDQLDGNTLFAEDEILLNKDPRFLASAFYPSMPWQGGTVYMHTSTVGEIPADSDWPEAAPPRNRTKTGFMIRKRVNEDVLLPEAFTDETDWIVFRTGELYLNAAEAAFERGETGNALELINEIRDRAGMPAKSDLTIEDIRNERFVELFMEEHRYWDLRRWRIAEEELNGKGFHGVLWHYHIEEDKFALELKDGEYGGIRTFAERNYYFPIGLGRLADNPALVENPGY